MPPIALIRVKYRLVYTLYLNFASQFWHLTQVINARHIVKLPLTSIQQTIPSLSMCTHQFRHSKWQRPHEVIACCTIPVPYFDRQTLRVVCLCQNTAQQTKCIAPRSSAELAAAAMNTILNTTPADNKRHLAIHNVTLFTCTHHANIKTTPLAASAAVHWI